MGKKIVSHVDENLKNALQRISRRAQLQFDCKLTHDDLANIAGVNKRSFGDWMRGVTAPQGMCAIFELLSQLDDEHVREILDEWRKEKSTGVAQNKKKNTKVEDSIQSRKKMIPVLRKKKVTK